MVSGMMKIVDFIRGACGRRAGDSGSLFEAEYVVLDTELTGLNDSKDSIVSIGAVRMQGGRIALGDTFYRLVNPSAKLTGETVVVHGIRQADVDQKPSIGSVIKEFAEFAGSAVMVGHVLSIDLGFLNREAKKHIGRGFRNPAVDTFMLHEWLKRWTREYPCFAIAGHDLNLYKMAGCMDVPVSETHNSETDAFITAQIFQRFMPLLKKGGIKSVEDLVKAGDPDKRTDSEDLSSRTGHF